MKRFLTYISCLAVFASCLSVSAFFRPVYPEQRYLTYEEYVIDRGAPPDTNFDMNDPPWLTLGRDDALLFRAKIREFLFEYDFVPSSAFQMYTNDRLDGFFDNMQLALNDVDFVIKPYDLGMDKTDQVYCLLGYYDIPGYPDRIVVGLYLDFEKGIVKDAVLCAAHHVDRGFGNSSGLERFLRVYPMGTTLDTMLTDAAAYLESQGKTADDHEGIPVGDALQQELRALFGKRGADLSFVYCYEYGEFDGFWWPSISPEYQQQLYYAVYARHQILLWQWEAEYLSSTFYCARKVYPLGEHSYTIDFCAKERDKQHTTQTGFLTWITVRPVGSEELFFYSAATNLWVIEQDMKTYFNDPENGKSILAW